MPLALLAEKISSEMAWLADWNGESLRVEISMLLTESVQHILYLKGIDI